MKYKVGDKVRIRENLEAGKTYGKKVLLSTMEKYLGCEATIKAYREESGYYVLDKDAADGHWGWSEEMLEPVTECDFKVGDKVIIKPGRECSKPGIFTITSMYNNDDETFFRLNDSPSSEWHPNNFLKVPLFKIGQIVQFHNIKEDKWYSAACMVNLENKYGIITKVIENRYVADKQGQDGCTYEVKDFQDGEEWCVTSTSLELVPMGKTSCITSVKQDELELISDTVETESIVARPITAEMLAQAVDNVKGPQFKIGDRVLIREDLVPGKRYEEWDYSPKDGLGGWVFAAAMAKYMGKVATITGYVANDPNYCCLDIDKGTYSWIVNALLHYTPGSDYDLDKQIINQQKTIRQNENRLQEKGPVIAGRERQSGCAVRYPGEQIRVGISNLGYRKVTCKR